MLDPLEYNPAVAGLGGGICANLMYRDQWVGVDGAPKTIFFNGDLPVKFLHGGIGLNIMQDQIGPFKELDVRLEYAYHFYNIGPGNLTIGGQLGFFNTKLDFSDLHPLDASDPVLSSTGTQSSFTVDYGLGAFYQVKDKWYAGLSSSQIGETTESLGNAKVQQIRDYYLTGGYHISLDNQGLPGFEVIPSTLIKTDGVTLQFDVNAMVQYNNKFWVGVSYRKTDAVVIMIGLKPFGPGIYENLKIGYSYDLTTSAMGSGGGSSGSHEIYLGYCIKIETQKPQESYKNVRFL
jgi:type IX secretion system PorP/SprF family membrane protein